MGTSKVKTKEQLAESIRTEVASEKQARKLGRMLISRAEMVTGAEKEALAREMEGHLNGLINGTDGYESYSNRAKATLLYAMGQAFRTLGAEEKSSQLFQMAGIFRQTYHPIKSEPLIRKELLRVGKRWGLKVHIEPATDPLHPGYWFLPDDLVLERRDEGVSRLLKRKLAEKDVVVVDVDKIPKISEMLGKRLADISGIEKVRAVPEESVVLRQPGEIIVYAFKKNTSRGPVVTQVFCNGMAPRERLIAIRAEFHFGPSIRVIPFPDAVVRLVAESAVMERIGKDAYYKDFDIFLRSDALRDWPEERRRRLVTDLKVSEFIARNHAAFTPHHEEGHLVWRSMSDGEKAEFVRLYKRFFFDEKKGVHTHPEVCQVIASRSMQKRYGFAGDEKGHVKGDSDAFWGEAFALLYADFAAGEFGGEPRLAAGQILPNSLAQLFFMSIHAPELADGLLGKYGFGSIYEKMREKERIKVEFSAFFGRVKR